MTKWASEATSRIMLKSWNKKNHCPKWYERWYIWISPILTSYIGSSWSYNSRHQINNSWLNPNTSFTIKKDLKTHKDGMHKAVLIFWWVIPVIVMVWTTEITWKGIINETKKNWPFWVLLYSGSLINVSDKSSVKSDILVFILCA